MITRPPLRIGSETRRLITRLSSGFEREPAERRSAPTWVLTAGCLRCSLRVGRRRGRGRLPRPRRAADAFLSSAVAAAAHSSQSVRRRPPEAPPQCNQRFSSPSPRVPSARCLRIRRPSPTRRSSFLGMCSSCPTSSRPTCSCAASICRPISSRASAFPRSTSCAMPRIAPTARCCCSSRSRRSTSRNEARTG